MPPVKKGKVHQVNSGNSSLRKILLEKQEEYSKIIGEQKDKIKSSSVDVIIKGSDVLYNAVTDNLPTEVLEMKYSEFLNQMNNSSFIIDKPNDTLAAIQDLRNRVNDGTATLEEISRYRKLKNLL